MLETHNYTRELVGTFANMQKIHKTTCFFVKTTNRKNKHLLLNLVMWFLNGDKSDFP